MNARRRLERLEQRLESYPTPEQTGGLAQEIRVIDETMARLEAEIAEAEANMTPEEVQRGHAEHEADMAFLGGLALEEKIAALELAIAKLEAEEETDERRG
jgi:hypothetical protein